MVDFTLDKIFYSQDPKEEPRNPNDPANGPYYKALWGIENKAWIRWYEDCGGERLLKEMERGIINKIHKMVMMEVRSIDSVFALLEIKRDIQKDAQAIDRILLAFTEEDKRQEALKDTP